MARPPKQGLEYFALDVAMNDEVELIEAVHGLAGFAILIKLFQKIYSEGYFIDWHERDRILFSNRVSGDRNQVTSVVSDCIRWGIFDQESYDKHGILTSRRIQDQYFTATYKRVNVIAIKEYLLVDVSGKDHVVVTGVSDDGNGATTQVPDDKNKETSRVSGDKSTQSKSKSKSQSKNKVKELSTEPSKDASMQEHVFIKLPLNDGTEHLVTEKDLQRYAELYPAVDIKQDLRNMAGWLEANPTKRKTKNGVRRFITNWLARTQNAGGSKGNGQSATARTRQGVPDNRYFLDEQPEYDWESTIAHYKKLTDERKAEEALNAGKHEGS